MSCDPRVELHLVWFSYLSTTPEESSYNYDNAMFRRQNRRNWCVKNEQMLNSSNFPKFSKINRYLDCHNLNYKGKLKVYQRQITFESCFVITILSNPRSHATNLYTARLSSGVEGNKCPDSVQVLIERPGEGSTNTTPKILCV